MMGPCTNPFLSLGHRVFLCNRNTRALGESVAWRGSRFAQSSAVQRSYEQSPRSTLLPEDYSLALKGWLSLGT